MTSQQQRKKITIVAIFMITVDSSEDISWCSYDCSLGFIPDCLGPANSTTRVSVIMTVRDRVGIRVMQTYGYTLPTCCLVMVWSALLLRIWSKRCRMNRSFSAVVMTAAMAVVLRWWPKRFGRLRQFFLFDGRGGS